MRISHLHRNKLARTMDSLVHSEHCKHAATVFPWTNGKPLQYAPLTLSTEGGSIIDPALSFVCPTIISYLVTFSGLSPREVPNHFEGSENIIHAHVRWLIIIEKKKMKKRQIIFLLVHTYIVRISFEQGNFVSRVSLIFRG